MSEEQEVLLGAPAFPTRFPERRERMGQLIVKFEARRNAQGHLAVYPLPSGDGGGTYEVAGINDRYHPKAASELRSLIRAGRHAEAEVYVNRYLADYTEPVRSMFSYNGTNNADDYPGIEFFLRDTTFNRGFGGASKILQKAIGVTTDGGFGPKSKEALQGYLKAKGWQALLNELRKSREWYERVFARRNESSKFWKGLVNRWNGAEAKALTFA